MKRNITLILVSIVVIAFFSLGTLISPDRDFSENENRYLQENPKLNVKNVLSGKYEEKAEDYLSDQIIERDFWVEMTSFIQQKTGIRDVNGVYVLKNGRLVQQITDQDFNWKRYENNLDAIAELKNTLQSAKIDLNVMLVNTAGAYYKSQADGVNELPDYALIYDEDKALKTAEDKLGDSYIDLSSVLNEYGGGNAETDDLYFKTDHHWNNTGAYLGYKTFMEKIGKTVPALEDIEMVKLTDDFYGTLFSKALYYNGGADTIETPEYACEMSAEVKLDDESSDSLYFMDRLEQKDKYEVFFGGNYGKVTIDTGNKGKRLLILKDSYANIFVPYLMKDFSEICMIDTRYFRGSVEETAQDYDEVLVLYSINNFADEKIVLSGTLS